MPPFLKENLHLAEEKGTHIKIDNRAAESQVHVVKLRERYRRKAYWRNLTDDMAHGS